MATNTPQDDFHKTGLRLPKPLHAQLHAAAASSGRSYNSEIVARLQASFEEGQDKLPSPRRNSGIADPDQTMLSLLTPKLKQQILDSAAEHEHGIRQDVIYRLKETFDHFARYDKSHDTLLQELRDMVDAAKQEFKRGG